MYLKAHTDDMASCMRLARASRPSFRLVQTRGFNNTGVVRNEAVNLGTVQVQKKPIGGIRGGCAVYLLDLFCSYRPSVSLDFSLASRLHPLLLHTICWKNTNKHQQLFRPASRNLKSARRRYDFPTNYKLLHTYLFLGVCPCEAYRSC